MTDKNAVAEMARREKEIQDLIEEGKKFADLHGLTFYTGVLEVSLGATYHGIGNEEREEHADFNGWYNSYLSG